MRNSPPPKAPSTCLDSLWLRWIDIAGTGIVSKSFVVNQRGVLWASKEDQKGLSALRLPDRIKIFTISNFITFTRLITHPGISVPVCDG